MKKTVFKEIENTNLTEEMVKTMRGGDNILVLTIHKEVKDIVADIQNIDLDVLRKGDAIVFNNFLLLLEKPGHRIFHKSMDGNIREVEL